MIVSRSNKYQEIANALRYLSRKLDGNDRAIVVRAASLLMSKRSASDNWTTAEERRAMEAFTVGGVRSAMEATGRTEGAIRNRARLRGWVQA